MKEKIEELIEVLKKETRIMKTVINIFVWGLNIFFITMIIIRHWSIVKISWPLIILFAFAGFCYGNVFECYIRDKYKN